MKDFVYIILGPVLLAGVMLLAVVLGYALTTVINEAERLLKTVCYYRTPVKNEKQVSRRNQKR
jgi:hypothetical protein